MIRLGTIVVLLIVAVWSFGEIKPASVNSDLLDTKNLTDGLTNTYATGKAGDNTIIFQLGSLKYVKSLEINFKTMTRIKKITVAASSDFFNWSNIIVGENKFTNVLRLDFGNVPAMYLKAVISAEAGFAIAETVLSEGGVPSNEISDIKVSGIGEAEATISWKTKVESQDFVTYAKKYLGNLETIIDIRYVKEHSVTLKSLKKGSDYVYSIVSESPDKTRIESKTLEFRTLGVPLPEIWELKAQNITPFSARLYYKANVATAYEVKMGTDPTNLKQVIKDDWRADSRDFELKSLQPETQYFYQLYVKDQFGNVYYTPPISFATPANNIALGKKVWGSFNYVDEDIKKRGFGETSAEKTVDGSLNYFGGMALSFNADNADQYLIIDLGQNEPIKRLDVYWWGLSYSRNYSIELSDNGKDWTTAKSGLDANDGQVINSAQGDIVVKHSVPLSANARYVRLYVKAGAARGCKDKKWLPRNQLYLCEVAVIK